jgi:hypothetical protein
MTTFKITRISFKALMDPGGNYESAQEIFYSNDFFAYYNQRINDTLTGPLTGNRFNGHVLVRITLRVYLASSA